VDDSDLLKDDVGQVQAKQYCDQKDRRTALDYKKKNNEIHKQQEEEEKQKKDEEEVCVCVCVSGLRLRMWYTVMHEIPISSHPILMTSLPYPRTQWYYSSSTP
jgi:hypothetical protein